MLIDCEMNNVTCPLLLNKDICHRLVKGYGAKKVKAAVEILKNDSKAEAIEIYFALVGEFGEAKAQNAVTTLSPSMFSLGEIRYHIIHGGTSPEA
jgi:hypothetical protein